MRFAAKKFLKPTPPMPNLSSYFVHGILALVPLAKNRPIDLSMKYRFMNPGGIFVYLAPPFFLSVFVFSPRRGFIEHVIDLEKSVERHRPQRQNPGARAVLLNRVAGVGGWRAASSRAGRVGV